MSLGRGRLSRSSVGGRRELLVDDLVAEIDALVADVDAGTGDQLLHLPLALAAKAAEQLLVSLARSGHWSPLLLRFHGFGYPGRVLGGSAVRDHPVDDPVLHRLLGGHEEVTVHVRAHLLLVLLVWWAMISSSLRFNAIVSLAWISMSDA